MSKASNKGNTGMITDIMKQPRARAAVKLALEEDIGSGDVTSLSLVDPKARAVGQIYSRVPCVVAGATVAKAVQGNIISAVESMTGIKISAVNVKVGGVAFEKETKKKKPAEDVAAQ